MPIMQKSDDSESGTEEEANNPIIPSSVLFAAVRDVLLDHFSDARIVGIRLQPLQVELLASDIVDRAILLNSQTEASEEEIF